MLVVAYAGRITYTGLLKKLTTECFSYLIGIVLPPIYSLDLADYELVMGYGKSYSFYLMLSRRGGVLPSLPS